MCRIPSVGSTGDPAGIACWRRYRPGDWLARPTAPFITGMLNRVVSRSSIIGIVVESWADIATLLSSRLAVEDAAGGWTDELRCVTLEQAEQMGEVGIRLLPSHAAGLLKTLKHYGVSSGPIFEAIAAATRGVPGVGTTQAVALAVKGLVVRTRTLGFTGRSPTVRRVLEDGTIQTINFQRMNSGVTGREPSFTVNLSVVPGSLRRAATRAWGSIEAEEPGSFTNGVVTTRLGHITSGRDVWWHPSTEAEAEATVAQVFEDVQNSGLHWLQRMSNPASLLEELLASDHVLDTDLILAALLVDSADDGRRDLVARSLRRWPTAAIPKTKLLKDWLLQQLTSPYREEQALDR